MKLKKEWIYEAELVRVIDGDTYVFSMDVGFDIYPHITIRIIGAYAPEIKGASKEEGFLSQEYAQKLLKKAKLIEIKTQKSMSFTRYLGEVFIDGENLAELMIAKGFAKNRV